MRLRWILQHAICLTAILLLMAGTPRPADADGGAFPPVTAREIDVEMPAQKAILVWDEAKGHEDLILSVELLGGPEAAWVVPLPSLPEVKVASPKWFEQLSDLTKPLIITETQVVYRNGWEVEVEKAVSEDVELISREEVGVYDVSILSADEAGALLDWLNENGYAFPEEGRPILDAYVEEGGWYFVAARVLPGESAHLDGDVQPLWFSFDVEQPIYPMRLTSLLGKKLVVLIYLLADHRMSLRSLFATDFAAKRSLSPLSQESDADLVDLLTHRPYYVTKLINRGFRPYDMKEDLYFKRADSDAPYRRVKTVYRYVYRRRTETAPNTVETESPATKGPTKSSRLFEAEGSLVLAAGLTLLVLLAGLSLICRRRSRRKAGEE